MNDIYLESIFSYHVMLTQLAFFVFSHDVYHSSVTDLVNFDSVTLQYLYHTILYTIWYVNFTNLKKKF